MRDIVSNKIFWFFAIVVFLITTSFSINFDEDSFYGIKTVVIDAGHGGHDGGCQGSFSNEKDVALAISVKLRKHIEDNFKDSKVVYTRTTDGLVTLDEKAKIANKAQADLFICIHVNSGPTTAMGTETYVMGLHKTESNLNVAKRDNSSILLEDDYETRYENFDPNSPESYIVLTLRQSAFIEQSLNFAAKVQAQFKDRVGRIDRGVKQAGFLVLHQTNMPSVLIETGFLTNKEEEKFLNTPLNQDYMASAIYRAFKEYKTEIEDKLLKKENEEKPESPKETPAIETPKEKPDKKEKPKDTPKEEGLVFKVQI